MRAAQDKRVPVSFDGNYRSKLWESWRSEAPGILKQIFQHADIVFGDDRDIALVLGREFDGTPEERRARAAVAAFEAFPRLKRIACTVRVQHTVDHLDYGAVMFVRGGATHEAPAVELPTIVDRVGTGDAFAAGIIHALLSGRGDGEALKFGLAAACLKHSIPGDFLTLPAGDVEAAMGNGGLDVKR